MIERFAPQPVKPIDLEKFSSIFAIHPSEEVSQSYGFVPTSQVVIELEKAGFFPVRAQESRVKNVENKPYTKHLIRFRHLEHLARVGDSIPEVVLVNAHNGSSSYRIMAGVYRLVCTNGLIVGASMAAVRIRHTKNAPSEIIDASFRVIDALPKIANGIDTMRSIALEPGERIAFATAALTLRYGEKSPVRPEQILTPRRHEDRSNDLWTTFNTVQEHIIRGGQLRQDNQPHQPRRRTRSITSVTEDIKLNHALWTLAEEMQKLKV